MKLSAKALRAQLYMLRPLLQTCSLETLRRGQDLLGELIESRFRQDVMIKEHDFGAFKGAWILPKDRRRQGVMLYLHGGGFACGGLDYAKGFGSTLAIQCGVRVFCAAYRLAPEHPYPAALEDALTAYQYLLEKGYDPRQIVLCGESAGGGLCYSLCALLRQKGIAQPAGIVAVSPWVDLTQSGETYETNKDTDVSMTKAVLDHYAGLYCADVNDPLVSPLLGELKGLPPSLLYAGGDEVLLSDARRLHEKLLQSGCKSTLTVKPGRWHAYVLYNLAEDQHEYANMNRFLDRNVGRQSKLRWMRLDNAAKIYPAARRQNWSNVFRVSVTLNEPVDKEVLRKALDVTARRFPSMAVRLRKGAFWYYLQQVEHLPEIREESSHPLVRMSRKETGQCAFRVIVFRGRIALEFFHSVTDGTGAMIFLKTLVAEYILQKYGVSVPATDGVLGRLEDPSEEELEDSFPKYAGKVTASRQGSDAWRISGTPEKDGFLDLTCMSVPTAAVVAKAKEYKVSVTQLLCGALMVALQNMQAQQVPNIRRRKAIKLQVPVNLRNIFPSRSLRNFALYTTPEIDPRLGEYSLEEACKAVHHHMGMDVTAKSMSKLIAANVGNEQNPLVKVMPLFIKNLVMKAVFSAVGERKSCLSLSNLGVVQLPEQMRPYVERFDFILGVQATAPHNCGVVSYGDTLRINMIRNIEESDLEYHFYRVLQQMDLPVQVQSNRG